MTKTLLFIAVVEKVLEFVGYICICIIALNIYGKKYFIFLPIVDIPYSAVPIIACILQIQSLELASGLVRVSLTCLLDDSKDGVVSNT